MAERSLNWLGDIPNAFANAAEKLVGERYPTSRAASATPLPPSNRVRASRIRRAVRKAAQELSVACLKRFLNLV